MLFFAERENGNDFMQEGKRKMKQTMDKERWKGWLISFFMETLGGFLVAVALDSFAVNAGFPLTGFSGIALIFNRLWGMPIGVTIILLNIPLAFLCYKLLGKGFFLRSIRCMIISSIFIDYIGPMLPAYDGDRLLAALCTGVTMGLGYGLIYMQNSSTGGADFVVMALKAVRPHLSLGRLAFITDVVIVLAGGFLFRDVDWHHLWHDCQLHLLGGHRQGDVRCKRGQADADCHRTRQVGLRYHRRNLQARHDHPQGSRWLQAGGQTGGYVCVQR